MGDSVSEGTVAEFPKQPGQLLLCLQSHRQYSHQLKQLYCSAVLKKAFAQAFSSDSPHLCPGDTVQEDDVVVQIETDKVTIDVRYTESAPGKIKEFLVKPEDTVTVGQEVAVIDKGAGDAGGGGEPYMSLHSLAQVETFAVIKACSCGNRFHCL